MTTTTMSAIPILRFTTPPLPQAGWACLFLSVQCSRLALDDVQELIEGDVAPTDHGRDLASTISGGGFEEPGDGDTRRSFDDPAIRLGDRAYGGRDLGLSYCNALVDHLRANWERHGARFDSTGGRIGQRGILHRIHNRSRTQRFQHA